jgi:hypothetical protein
MWKGRRKKKTNEKQTIENGDAKTTFYVNRNKNTT